MNDINRIIKLKTDFLREKGVEVSEFEVKLLLADVLGVEVGNLRFYNQRLSNLQSEKFEKMIDMRAAHKPVDKILGYKAFYKHDFIVSEDVLSPRQDTEILIEETLKVLPNNKPVKMLEFGVGSGCIIISLLDEIKNATGIGADISEKALNICKKNAERVGVANRLKLVETSWFDCQISDNDFDLIISNPPYIPSDDIISLDDEVKNFDPLIALDGGKDGLRDYRQIAKIAYKMLKNGGFLVFEAGVNQAGDIVKIAKENGFDFCLIARDLGDIERCIILKK